MKRIIKYFFLHYFAGKAMASIISNQRIYDAIVRLSVDKESEDRDNEITNTVVNLSYRYAKKMVDKI